MLFRSGWELAKSSYNWVLAAPGASALVKGLADYDLGLLYFLVPGVDKLQDLPRLDKAIDFFNQYKSAKGTAQGASWPSDIDDLLGQAQIARRNAVAAAAGAGGTAPKGGPTAAPKPTAAATTPPAPKPSTTPPAPSACKL